MGDSQDTAADAPADAGRPAKRRGRVEAAPSGDVTVYGLVKTPDGWSMVSYRLDAVTAGAAEVSRRASDTLPRCISRIARELDRAAQRR